MRAQQFSGQNGSAPDNQIHNSQKNPLAHTYTQIFTITHTHIDIFIDLQGNECQLMIQTLNNH